MTRKLWADRQIRGRGRFGVAYGGLGGEGDVELCGTEAAARKKLSDAFRELLSPDTPGTLIRGGYLDRTAARVLLADVDSQANHWKSEQDGSTVDVSVAVVIGDRAVDLSVGVFKCMYGPMPGDNVNTWWIPPMVRVPHGLGREVKLPEPKKVRR